MSHPESRFPSEGVLGRYPIVGEPRCREQTHVDTGERYLRVACIKVIDINDQHAGDHVAEVNENWHHHWPNHNEGVSGT